MQVLLFFFSIDSRQSIQCTAKGTIFNLASGIGSLALWANSVLSIVHFSDRLFHQSQLFPLLLFKRHHQLLILGLSDIMDNIGHLFASVILLGFIFIFYITNHSEMNLPKLRSKRGKCSSIHRMVFLIRFLTSHFNHWDVSPQPLEIVMNTDIFMKNMNHDIH